ncbi:UNVERIFIED_CONTAM: hypothetical protein K2H54_047249 [Gekko kuhli]
MIKGRDATDSLQCILTDEVCQCYNWVILSIESMVAVYGNLNLVSEDKQAPRDHEFSCDYWEHIGLAPGGGVDNLVNKETGMDLQLNNQHMII